MCHPYCKKSSKEVKMERVGDNQVFNCTIYKLQLIKY